jgi:opacity protein-like surface antigen
MSFGKRLVASGVFALAVAGVSTAQAQEPAWGDLIVSAARINYDLSGTGNAAGIAVRTRRNLSSNVALELGGVFAKPEQQIVGPSTLFVPEAQLQYRWGAGRLSPYVGGGIGAALVKSDFRTDWDPTLSLAVGTGVRLTERLGVTGEFRLRGHEWDFVGTTAEISAGLAWRFPSF